MGKSSFLQDFKAFAMRGNVIDMAVGVIIGGAFGKIVSSIVADVIMPPIGLLVGGVNFTDLKLQLKPAEVVDGVEKAAVTLNYGNFLQATFDFIIIAFSIFLFIRLLAKLNRKKEEVPAPAAPPAPSKEEVLLTEIRDLLKEQAGKNKILSTQKTGLPSNACRTARDLYTSRHFLNIPIFFFAYFSTREQEEQSFSNSIIKSLNSMTDFYFF